MNEYLFEIKEDWELMRELNVSDREIESQIYGWNRDTDDTEYIPFL